MADAPELAGPFLEGCPAVQWIADSAGVFRRIYGDPSALLGASAADLLGRSADSIWLDRYVRVMAGEVLYIRERRGGSIWNITVFPVRVEGEVRFAGASAQDAAAWGSAEAQLRDTVFRVLDTQESDRKMVARFLHDSIGQTLTALGLQLELARMDLESGAADVPARLQDVQRILGQMMDDVRHYVNELNPSTVERSGLAPALERLAARIREQFHGELRVQVDPALRLSPRVGAALYRVAHEAAENALKHSGCYSLEIIVQSTSTGTILEVRDDGRGFDSAEISGVFRGLGLLSMEHYAVQAGVELSVASSREAGTVVRASAGAT